MLLSEIGHLADGASEEDRAHLETISDVNVACSTAVEILNDLLSFEKVRHI